MGVDWDYQSGNGGHSQPMSYVEGTSREQQVLFPEALDDYISEENLVRFIDAFVDGLEIEELGFCRAAPKETGRPPYDPRDLLKLYIYGYVNRIRTGRTLERECHRNLELMWLMRKLVPDFKTITDFRKDNRQAFKGVFRQFVLLCKGLGLVGGELVAVDGSKFKAVNSGQRNFTGKKLERRLKELDHKVERYLDEMDRTDRCEQDRTTDKEELKKNIEKLKERKGRYEELLKELNRSGQSQVSLTDPDSRAMALTPRGDVSYNVQTAVDQKHHLIVEQEVTNEVLDNHQLFTMAQRTRDLLGQAQLQVVADMGYYNHEQLKQCEDAGITAHVSKPLVSKNTARGLFGKEKFVYQAEQDSYRCPANERLDFRFESQQGDKKFRYYWTKACPGCALRSQCTTDPRFHRIKRWEHEAVLERTEQRVKANSAIMKLRQQLVEHPFGSMKFWNDQRHFLMKGLEKVRAEFSLSTLAYDIKRAMNLVGLKALMAALN
jgi:transposase